MTRQDIANRRIFNIHPDSQGKQGYDFTAVFSDAERRALIESLKIPLSCVGCRDEAGLRVQSRSAQAGVAQLVVQLICNQ